MLRGIYPGSFDPVTFGHLDLIERGAKMADELIVAVLCNNAKTPLFFVEERVRMLQEVTKDIDNVKVMAFEGLLVDFVDEVEANVIIRGLRAVTDFDYELQIAQTNRKLNPKVETVFLATSLEYSYLSSSIVREVAKYNGDISRFVPAHVEKTVKHLFEGEYKNE